MKTHVISKYKNELSYIFANNVVRNEYYQYVGIVCMKSGTFRPFGRGTSSVSLTHLCDISI